ncbi:hypothetical protein like AT1G78230 [Hibiscus trionum]|uniref:Uncharacterized protein n=1 Tax=Hibiscus trionum TaxID=183268 RepID=A0A9W7GU06_HIBTR|nr:hypothetical protein like AT1G78230 [Hibiscus trionum]
MVTFTCFPLLKSKNNNKKKGNEDDAAPEGARDLQKGIEKWVQPFESDEPKLKSFAVLREESLCNAKVISPESPLGFIASEVAYEGEDEHEEDALIGIKFSDFEFQSHVTSSVEAFDFRTKRVVSSDSFEISTEEVFINQDEKDAENSVDTNESGHISDPGIERTEFWAIPSLKRSCSNLETRNVQRKVVDQFPRKSRSFEELCELSARAINDLNAGSPASVMTRCNTERVMLKKHSSSQVLPSRSRKLWWKLFLWSHRNLHKFWPTKPKPLPLVATSNQQGGYPSDTVEPDRALNASEMESPGSFIVSSLNKDSVGKCDENQSWKGFHNGVTSSLWPQNQWVELAFPSSSPSFARVDEWVRGLDVETTQPADDMNGDECTTFPFSVCTGKSPARNTPHSSPRFDMNLSEEMLYANDVIQTLDFSSVVAHISGINLKAIPTISGFSSLRSVNLSNNFIVQVTPGSLPKGLHTLNLSKNKINNIEGLRELTRLRVVDLSYNRVARIGHGLSNCILIKELYLAGNKISDVEGLHRLFKLTVLDLSFNKISTTKAFSQLAANYNTLQALNLLGNPVLGNNAEEQLRKAVCSLLPKLRYLNKQPIKPQRAREALTDSVAKAALGSGNWSSRRQATKRAGQGGSTICNVHRNSVATGKKNNKKLKSRSRRQ